MITRQEINKRYYLKHKTEIIAKVKEKYHNDPVFREKVLKLQSKSFKKRYYGNPEFRKKRLEMAKRRILEKKLLLESLIRENESLKTRLKVYTDND